MTRSAWSGRRTQQSQMLKMTRGWTFADKLCEEEDDEENCNTVRSLAAMFGESIRFDSALTTHFTEQGVRTTQHKHPNLILGFYTWAYQYFFLGQQTHQQSQFFFFLNSVQKLSPLGPIKEALLIMLSSFKIKKNYLHSNIFLLFIQQYIYAYLLFELYI